MVSTRPAAAFFGVALGATLGRGGRAQAPGSGRIPNAKAKSVIFLFMCGGVSHIDTFDPKDNKWAGKLIDAIGFGDNLAEMQAAGDPLHPHVHALRRDRASRSPTGSPHVGGVIDEIAVVRVDVVPRRQPLPGGDRNCTGHRGRQFDHPTFGSWVSYALGSANKNLPTFVNIGRPSSPVQLTGGYLGAQLRGDAVPARGDADPESEPARRRQCRRARPADADAGRGSTGSSASTTRSTPTSRPREAYELAARMQLSPRRRSSTSRTSRKHVLDLYGIGEKATDDFGRQLLLARRLAEKGVRFIQVCHAGGGNGGWDAHGDMKNHAPLCRAIDKPIAGLIRDLKQRGMLERTLVVWTSEFGRSPWSQNTTGRDHNPRGYTAWLAGGGVKGAGHGATDDVGYKAVENPHYYSDLHATILQRGPRPHEDAVPALGRTFHLVEEGDGPIKAIIG